MKNNNPLILPERRLFLALPAIALIAGGLLIFTFIGPENTRFFCTQPASDNFHSMTSPIQLKAILHYATSRIVPQQSFSEITVSFDVLRSISPCNFLVFGLGHDSLMWASFNTRGKTLFLEEDPTWVQTVLKDAPDLNAAVVKYRTKLSEADELMNTYRSEPECAPAKSYIKGNTRCSFSLDKLNRKQARPKACAVWAWAQGITTKEGIKFSVRSVIQFVFLKYINMREAERAPEGDASASWLTMGMGGSYRIREGQCAKRSEDWGFLGHDSQTRINQHRQFRYI